LNERHVSRITIILLKKHHSHAEIERFYNISDICMVTSLHDGMNLVAKEYISAKEDKEGVLILSRRQLTFLELFSPEQNKLELVVTFLALLELMRQRIARAVQERPFSDILITTVTAADTTSSERQ